MDTVSNLLVIGEVSEAKSAEELVLHRVELGGDVGRGPAPPVAT